MPRAVVVTKLDKDRADFDEAVAICQRVFGDGVLPLYLPMAADDGSPAGLIGLLSQRIFDYSSGTRVERDPDAEHLPLIETARNALIEGIIAESEDETPDGPLPRAARTSTSRCSSTTSRRRSPAASFYPVLATASPTGLGMAELLEVITQGFPSPLEHDVPPVTTPDGKPARPARLRPGRPARRRGRQDDDRPVRRPDLPGPGLLRHAAPGHDGARLRATSSADRGHEDHDVDERVGALSSPLGKTQRTVAAVHRRRHRARSPS